MEFKLVIVVREDLKMSVGKLSAQVAHAAVSCSLDAKSRKPKWFSGWYSEGQRKVVLKVKGVDELRALKDKATRAKLPNVLIADAGLTELPPGTATCLGIGPAPAKDIDPITGSLPLA
jgi:PTH2 family peptidyl-tRNA hydrolase